MCVHTDVSLLSLEIVKLQLNKTEFIRNLSDLLVGNRTIVSKLKL